MQRVLNNFEKELKGKIMQKCPPTQGEDTFLAKTFRFFDIKNVGAVNFEQFYRAVEKIGVTTDKQDLERIFQHCDANGNGEMDYKEFSSSFYGKSAQSRPQSEASYRGSPQKTSSVAQSSGVNSEQLMQLFRDKIRSRGARGIIGLQRVFKIMDDDNSKNLSVYEFGKACKDFKVGISEENIPMVFEAFDVNRDGILNYDEFLLAIIGPMNDFRKGLVEKAYRIIDKDHNGILDINDIKGTYNASKHPDVIAGRKTEDQILMEFLETFEMHHNLKNQGQNDSQVTLEEFIEYYRNVGASLPDDDYFAVMINNSWNVRGDAPTYQKYEKGWANEDKSAKPQFRDPPKPVRRSGQMSNDNPIATTNHLYTPTTQAGRQGVSNVMYKDPPMDKNTMVKMDNNLIQKARQEMPPTSSYQGGYNGPNSQNGTGAYAQSSGNKVNTAVQQTKGIPRFQTILVERLRSKLKERGGRGMIGMSRQFKIMDDNGSGTLDIMEFKKGMRDFGVDMEERDIENLFKSFDINGNGDIDYDEFVRVVVGPMNQFRTQIVRKAFIQVDKNQDGTLDAADIKGSYDASRHPDVRSGKKTEDEVFTEFLETFEMHHNMATGQKADGKVTLDEFIEYYTNISASVDNDAYFDLMMTNAWNLDGGNNTANMAFAGSSRVVKNVSARDAWRLDHHKNLFGTNKATPFVKSKAAEWQTSAGGAHNDGAFTAGPIQGAGSSTFQSPEEYKMQFMTKSQRTSDVQYRGVQHSETDLTKMFRQKLAQRGARGILGMQRVFKIMDDNGNGTLEISEFWKAICDFRIQMSPEEARILFDSFDLDHSDSVSYDELMRCVIGEMTPMRKALVKKAFNKLDANGNQIIEIDDIKKFYNAKQHPDVKSGKKTEEEVLSEFLDTFELHHSLKNPNEKDRKINIKEFNEYYNNVSASIDNDQYFELMITNAWNLNNQSHSRGWGGEI